MLWKLMLNLHIVVLLQLLLTDAPGKMFKEYNILQEVIRWVMDDVCLRSVYTGVYDESSGKHLMM